MSWVNWLDYATKIEKCLLHILFAYKAMEYTYGYNRLYSKYLFKRWLFVQPLEFQNRGFVKEMFKRRDIIPSQNWRDTTESFLIATNTVIGRWNRILSRLFLYLWLSFMYFNCLRINRPRPSWVLPSTLDTRARCVYNYDKEIEKKNPRTIWSSKTQKIMNFVWVFRSFIQV